MNTEDLLADTLRDRVAETDYPSTPMTRVATRAGAIRARRRRTTALAAAAAVAVVTVPGAVWLGRSPDGSPRPGQTVSSGPTTAPTSASSAATVLDALPLGRKPGIDYVAGDSYVGRIYAGRVTSPVLGRATAVAPVRGGLVAATPRGASTDLSDLVRLQGAGAATPLGCGAGTFALSTDGTQSAYWLADSCTGTSGGRLYSGALSTMGEAGQGFVVTAPGTVVRPVGITQQGIVVNAAASGATHAQLVDHAGRTSPIAGISSVGGSDENNDVVSGQLAADATTGAVVALGDGSVLFRVPGWQLGQFSSDGRYVVAHRLGGSAAYAILDAATGEQVARLDTLGDRLSVAQVAWDVDDTLLAVARDSSGEAIVRADLQGHLTRATPVAPVAPVAPQADMYTLATRS